MEGIPGHDHHVLGHLPKLVFAHEHVVLSVRCFPIYIIC